MTGVGDFMQRLCISYFSIRTVNATVTDDTVPALI